MKREIKVEDYFDIKYYINNGEVFKLSIKLKPSKIKNKKSSSNSFSVNWYIDKLGEKLGKEVFEVRKKFNSSNEIVNYLINTNIPENDKELLIDYKNKKDKQRKRTNKQTYADPEFKAKFNKIVNKKERVDKISKKAKEMWRNVKQNNRELYYRMVNTSKNKNYTINSVDMNYIEYQVAKILNKLDVSWKYEKIFNIGSHTYLPDFFCEDYNLIIECYGDFWHANPDIIGDRKYTHSNRSVEDVWKYDSIKESNFENDGYDFLYFWEDSILNDIKKVETKIKEKII